MGKATLILALATALVGAPAHAVSPAADAIDLVFEDCESDPVGESSFRQALRLELTQELRHSARPGASSPPSVPRITVHFDCEGVALIRIQLESSESQRRVRFDDVAKRETARALALVVAEQYRSQASVEQFAAESGEPENDETPGESASAARAGSSAETAKSAKSAKPTKPTKPTKPADKPRGSAAKQAASASSDEAMPSDAGVEVRPDAKDSAGRPRLRAAGTLRTALGEAGTHYGVSLGADLHVIRLGLDALFARETRARGAISSGVVALRVGRTISLVRAGTFELSCVPSAAIGVTWAVGQTEVVGSVVRDVLMPYGDARLALVSALGIDGEISPELGLHLGRAAGILARADGEATQATGGWFAGVEAGLGF